VASLYEKVLFTLRGAQKWPWADATVFDYILGDRRPKTNLQRVELSYSFWIEGHIYSGIAVWDESMDTDSNLYRKDDVVQIQYNPSDPNQSYFPEREDITTSFYLTLIGATLALPALIWIVKSLFHH
jgi:hypothetical protein